MLRTKRCKRNSINTRAPHAKLRHEHTSFNLISMHKEARNACMPEPRKYNAASFLTDSAEEL
jgi:hypothetical protein